MKWFKHKPVDPEVKEAYDQAYKEERIKQATERGRQAAQRKPFYQQLGGAMTGLGKGLMTEFKPRKGGKGAGDPLAFFMGSEKPKRRARRKRRRKR